MRQDPVASGSFAAIAATVAGTGATLRLALPPGNMHYLVASSNACGEGDLR